MSEQTTQEALQTVLLALSEFDSGDVVINDWTVLDQTTAKAPYIIIQNSDSFETDDVACTIVWDIPITIAEKWTDWQESLNAFRDTRQSVIDALQGLAYTKNIRNGSDIGEIYDRYNNDENAMPVFISQRIIVSAIDR